MSHLYHFDVKTSENHSVPVMVTVQAKGYDLNGNVIQLVQVWAIHNNTPLSLTSIGNVWSPNVKGYRRNKNDQYTIKSSNLDDDIYHFIKAFEKAVHS